MRIRVKSGVEVWTPDPAKPPNGAWRAGVVTWGNGHTYIMRWLDGGPESGRIKRQFVRPCPPPVPLPVNLAAGDTVELFDNNLWKLAEVVGGGAGNRRYDVKITGSTKVLTVDRSELRVQQRLTEDDVWVVVNKDNNEQGSTVPSRPIAGKNGTGLRKRSYAMMESDVVRCYASEQSAASSSGSSSSNDDGSSSDDDGRSSSTAATAVSRARTTVPRASAGTHHHPISGEKPPLLVVEQQEQHQEKQKQDDGDGDEDGRGHDMEVDAYMKVMKALHASGPLDWEKEELLANLRVHLHISGDEHLQVIWHVNGKKKPAGASRNGDS